MPTRAALTHSAPTHSSPTHGGVLRLLLVDPDLVVRSCLRALLRDRGDVVVVGECAAVRTAVRLVREVLPDVALVGAGPQIDDPVANAEALTALEPAPAVLALLTCGDDVEVMRAVEAGADGCVLNDSGVEELVASAHAVARGELVLPGRPARGTPTSTSNKE